METRTLRKLVSLRHGRDIGGGDTSAVLAVYGEEDVYNFERPHQALGYLTPMEFWHNTQKTWLFSPHF